MISALAGLMLSWHFSLPAGPAVVLSAAMLFFSPFLQGRAAEFYAAINLKGYL